MLRALLALTIFLANLGGPKVCCCLVTPPDARDATKVAPTVKVSGCCHAETCTKTPPTLTAPVSPPGTPCPYVYACAQSDFLALPESPTDVAGYQLATPVLATASDFIYPLAVVTTGYPDSVRHPLPPFDSGRDRLTAYSLLLC